MFRRLDYPLWRRDGPQPGADAPADQPASASTRPPTTRGFLALYDEAMLHDLDAGARGEAHVVDGALRHDRRRAAIAYFSAEFALHQSLPIYAGGLGVLAGDHCKEASDLGVPLVGVGFMYPQGYFHQQVSAEGWQQEVYEQLDWHDAPIEPARHAPTARRASSPCRSATAPCSSSVWRVHARPRARCYLLDTDLAENAPWDRELSARLYGGDRETRIQQEIILGVGGVRALRALGIDAGVWHLNEGHAAFVVLQRIRELLEQGTSFDAALEEVRRTTVFTTHTPVPGRPRRVPVPHGRDAPRRAAGAASASYRERVPRARRATTTAAARCST